MTARVKNPSVIVPQALLFVFGGLLVAVLESAGLLNIRLSYLALTLLLLCFLWIQVITIRRRHPQRWLLNPAVVSAFVFFTLGYGLSNVLYILPPGTIAFPALAPDIFPAMVTHQYLALLGAIMLYLGYWSPLATSLVRPRAVGRFQRLYLPATEALQPLAIPVLIGISLAVRMFALSQGLYGYGGDYSAERLAQTSSYSQYLSLLGGLGRLALLLAALQYFGRRGAIQGAPMFWAALIIEIFFGFLSGMKSAVVIPFVITGAAFYLRRGNIQLLWIAMAIIAVIVAYAVIEPFRELRQERVGALTSLRETTSVLDLALDADRTSRPDNATGYTLLRVLSRGNLSYIGAYGIEYADGLETLPDGSPAFLNNLFLAPAHAVVPRFIWNSKPLGDLGLWYNQVVLGNSHFSSTAMGPFTYLYFAGGYLAVAVAFFFLGALQRVLWFKLTPWANIPGAIIMMALLGTVANIDSAVNSLIISLIRDGILALLLVRVIFRPRRVQETRSPFFTAERDDKK